MIREITDQNKKDFKPLAWIGEFLSQGGLKMHIIAFIRSRNNCNHIEIKPDWGAERNV